MKFKGELGVGDREILEKKLQQITYNANDYYWKVVYCALNVHPNLHDNNCLKRHPLLRVRQPVVYVSFVHVIQMIRVNPNSGISCVNLISVFLVNGVLFFLDFTYFEIFVNK